MEDAMGMGPAAELTVHRRSLKALTGLRFFAASYVVVYHSRLGEVLRQRGHAAAGNFFLSGYLAVPLFFLLSGFILAYTYEGQIEERGGHPRFWEARFARIWPVYALSMVLASIPLANFGSIGAVVSSLFMVQAWDPWNLWLAGAGNAVCWTLSAEALFYLCFPWVQAWLERRSMRTIAVWTGLMLVLSVALNTGSRTLGYYPHGVFRWVPLAPVHLPEFLAGVGLGNFYLRRATPALRTPGRMALRGSGALTYGSMLGCVALLCRGADRWTSVVDIAFCGLIFGLSAERTLLSRLLSTPALVLGGGISYSMYLMQTPVKGWVNAAANHLHLESEAGRLGGTAVLLLLVSWLLFRFVEDPSRRVLRTFFARWEARRVALAKRKLGPLAR